MMILALVRNYIPSYGWVVRGGWNIADCVERSYDLEGMNVGTVAAGRIGLAALRRLKPFDVKLHYYDKHRLPEEVEKELGLTFHPNVESLVKVCDVVTINTPLHPETEHMFNDKLIGMMKRGSYIVNTARGKICDRDAIVRALESGQLAGYAGDVWFPQPAPKDHPWRTMPHHGMTPHISGSSLSAQTRYAAGTREISRELFRQEADPHRVSGRGQGQARRRRRPFLYGGRRDQGLRGSGEVQEGLIPASHAQSAPPSSRDAAPHRRVSVSASSSCWWSSSRSTSCGWSSSRSTSCVPSPCDPATCRPGLWSSPRHRPELPRRRARSS